MVVLTKGNWTSVGQKWETVHFITFVPLEVCTMPIYFPFPKAIIREKLY